MNKIFKKIISMIMAAVMAVFAATTAYADDPVIHKSESYASAIVSNVDYYAYACGKVLQQQYYYKIVETTQINKAIYLVTNNSVSPNVSNINVDWQVVNYITGANFGLKKEVSKTNAYVAEGEEQISIYAQISKFTVFGAHTAYQNGSTIIAKYTTTYNF